MKNLFVWFINTFPPREFMLRSNNGIKYFKVGTLMQIILITLLVTSGSLVALFTYKMQFLQTVNYKQNLALKDLRKKYTKFTNAVVSLREELDVEGSNFTDTDLNVELQIYISNFENNPKINYFKKNIFIGNPNFKKKKSFDVYIPTQTPGVDKNGLMVHSDGISIIKLKKLIDSPYSSVEEILTKVLES